MVLQLDELSQNLLKTISRGIKIYNPLCMDKKGNMKETHIYKLIKPFGIADIL